jgi:hypothetical protein
VAKEENADLNPSAVLMHGVRDGALLDYAVYDTNPIPPPNAPANLLDALYVSLYYFSLLLTQSRLGTWNLVLFEGQDGESSWGTMLKLDLILSGLSVEAHRTFSATGISKFGTSVVGQGLVRDGPEAPIISFSIKPGGYPTTYFKGPVNTNGASSVITFGYSANLSKNTGAAVISRVAEDILRRRPSPKAFRENKVRALWNYAIKTVLDSVRRSRLSWSYVAERRADRQRFLDLAKRRRYCGRPLNREESEELMRIVHRLRWIDVRFYMSMIELDLQENPSHRYGV